MQPIYNVPIIPQNLRREETVVQIAEALKYVSDVSNDIFKRVNDKINKNSAQMANINARIKNAKEKLSQLSGAKKATQVFSSSKYPAADINRPYESLFIGDALPVERFPHTFKETHIKDEPAAPVQFFHVNLQDDNEIEDNIGLGNIPKDITIVNDLFLYNSGKNLYDQYILSDTLQIPQGAKKEEVKESTEIGDAPLSISEGTAVNKTVVGSYFYSPDLGNVPIIDVPLDLPDLPGIADDLRYVSDSGPGIAPSVSSIPRIPELPVIVDDNPEISIEVIPENKPVVKEVVVKEAPTPAVVQKVVEEVIEIKQEVTATDGLASKVQNKHEVKKTFEVTDARASLMEAIRKAGGSKTLKATESRSETTVTAPAGNLMADLHAKLSMRRKGISGNKANNTEPRSAMDKVSAMIPPPPVKTDLSENTEDEEWD